jgi:hypothetical protein
MYGAILMAAMGAMSGVPTSAQQSPSLSSTDTEPELLPQMVSGMMESHNDTVCPSWQSITQAKEILVYLTGAVKLYADTDQEILTKSRTAPPETAAAMVRMVEENNRHLQVLTGCRDAIAEQLRMNSAAVQQLYEYNTLRPGEIAMFNDLSDDYEGQPNHFSKLLTMPDQRKTLHAIDLELRYLDFDLTEFRAMQNKDAGTPREATDRKILSRETAFRKALLAVRTTIAQKLNTAAPMLQP